jgi:methyl-accepting chemotaxis protein
LLFYGILSVGYLFYIILATFMVASVCSPFALHFAKVILDRLRRKLAMTLRADDFELIRFSFGIREKLLLVTLSLAIFTVIFGSLITFIQAEKALRQQAIDQLKHSINVSSHFLQDHDEKTEDARLNTIMEQFRMGSHSYLFLVRKDSDKHINNQNGYSLARMKEMQAKNYDLLSKILVRVEERKHSNYLIGGVFDARDFSYMISKMKRSYVVLIVIAFIIAGMLSIFYAHEIVGSLMQFMQAVAVIRSGDLTKRVHFISEDEIGDMAKILEQMRLSLYNVNVKIKNASNVVLLTAQKLFENMDNINSSSHEINRSTNKLEVSVNHQFEQVGHAATVMTQLRNSFLQVAERAELTAQTSKNASITAVEGSHEMQNIVNQMEEIRSVVQASRLSVDQLQKKSSEIQESVETIAQISRNTNKLALNAAIEAARSGEAGKGFSVVAEEVRKLAEASAAAASKIENKVNEIYVVTKRVSNSMIKGEEEVESGRDMVISTNNSFREIVQSFQEANKLANSIASETEEQAKNTEEISKIVNDTAKVSEITAASTKEVKDGTGQQTLSIEEMASQVKRMNALAEELQQLVSRYKLTRFK